MSNTVCGMSNTVCGMSNTVCSMSNTVCGMSNTVCGMSNTVCGMSNTVCSMSNTVCGMSFNDITACVYSDCSSGHGGDEAGAHDCPTVRINRLAGPDAHVCTYVQHFRPLSVHHDRQDVRSYSTYMYVCMNSLSLSG